MLAICRNSSNIVIEKTERATESEKKGSMNMTIIFDLNGKDRKQLVKAISEITGARAEYQRMPTCAFVIDFFTVTKEGMLEFPDRSDTEIVEQVLEGLAERGFAVISSYYDNGESAIETDEDFPTETPTEPDTAEATETEEVSEEADTTEHGATQPDTAAVTEIEEVSEETETTAQNETPLEDTPTAENNGIDRFSISMRRDFFDEAMFSKLDRLIESKSELFKMAFKTDDLSYEKSDDRVTFAWFPWTGDSDEGVAYSTFIDMLTKHIKEQKRVNAKHTQTENPKFAMRVFLIRLGMVGDEFKVTRKILLRNLKGSSAFRSKTAMFPSSEIIEALRAEYPVGSRVELLLMNDKQAPPIGTKGTVQGVDDAGSILVKWDNGCGLNVAYGKDKVKKLDSVKITCYGQTKVWDDRKEAVDFFLEAIAGSDGSERDRYSKIYAELMSGKIECSDEDENL